jgi:hypothetical protein
MESSPIKVHIVSMHLHTEALPLISINRPKAWWKVSAKTVFSVEDQRPSHKNIPRTRLSPQSIFGISAFTAATLIQPAISQITIHDLHI